MDDAGRVVFGSSAQIEPDSGGPVDPINVSQTLSERAFNCQSESGRVLFVFFPFVQGLFRKEI